MFALKQKQIKNKKTKTNKPITLDDYSHPFDHGMDKKKKKTLHLHYFW